MNAEWSDKLNAFWIGLMDNEYIAFKGSNQIFVYPAWNYPNPPTEIIQHTERIETVEEFEKALDTGKVMKATYQEQYNCLTCKRVLDEDEGICEYCQTNETELMMQDM